MQHTHAAKRLGPPIEELQSEPERIRIVIAQAAKKPEPNRILFSITERLSGEAPAEVLLRTDEQSFADVVVGNSYVVAWSYMRRNRRVIGGWETDPDGPFTVRLMGLGATALFEDTPDIRFLFAAGTMDVSGNKNQQIDALLAQMQRQDVRSRGLVISELYLRPDLTEAMQPAQADVLKSVLQKQALDPQHRDFIYRSALQLPKDMTTPWLAEEFRKTIILNGSQYDLGSFVPGLVRTAARGLQQTGGEADIDLLNMLLYSNNPGVAKAALIAMDHIDPGVTLVKAEQAIGRGWVHSETRSDLQRYLSQAKSH
ncbi:MAG: hypothetical protein WBN90_08665 [Gammaproteobacteria bacterium]